MKLQNLFLIAQIPKSGVNTDLRKLSFVIPKFLKLQGCKAIFKIISQRHIWGGNLSQGPKWLYCSETQSGSLVYHQSLTTWIHDATHGTKKLLLPSTLLLESAHSTLPVGSLSVKQTKNDNTQGVPTVTVDLLPLCCWNTSILPLPQSPCWCACTQAPSFPQTGHP